MSLITASELALLRSRPQASKLYLSIYRPKTVFAALVDDATITKGDTTITFDTVSTGSYSAIQGGQTLWVGSYAGGNDLGKVRVKSATASTLEVALNNDVVWSDGAFLTVLDFHEAWPVFYEIEVNPSDTDDVIIYKDGDIAYVNQNTILGTFVNMGCQYAGFSGDQVYYSATGTYNVAGQSLTYAWTFEGGSPGSSSSETPGNVTYATPGHYTTKLVVTAANGAVDTAYRHVSIYDPYGTSIVRQWGIASLNGSRDEGGYSASIWIRENIQDVVDGALIVIFSRDTFGTTSQEIGGNSYQRNRIMFVGYVVENSIRYDWRQSRVEFNVESVTNLMKRKEGLSVDIRSAADVTADAASSLDSRSPWYQIFEMNMKKAIYHYFRWHTTITQIADFKYIGRDYNLPFFEIEPTNLYDGLNNQIREKLEAQLISDRQGNLFVEPGASVTHNVTGTYPVGMELLKQDWMSEPEITINTLNQVSYVEVGGFAFAGGKYNYDESMSSSGTPTILLACAPGDTRSYSGKNDVGPQGLMLLTQDELNILAGDYFAYKNARYPSVVMNMSSIFRNIDIAPYEQYLLNVAREDTNRGIILHRKPFHVNGVSISFDSTKDFLEMEVDFHEITNGVIVGTTIEVPLTPTPNIPPTNPRPGLPKPRNPIIPKPVVPIPPPYIPTPPPSFSSGTSTCIDDLSAGENTMALSVGGGYFYPNHIYDYPMALALRNPSATYKSMFYINGCFEKYDPDTSIWSADTDNSWWRAFAIGSMNESKFEVQRAATGSGGCELRGGVFDNAAPSNITGIRINTSYSTGTVYSSVVSFLGWNRDNNCNYIDAGLAYIQGNLYFGSIWSILELSFPGALGLGNFRFTTTHVHDGVLSGKWRVDIIRVDNAESYISYDTAINPDGTTTVSETGLKNITDEVTIKLSETISGVGMYDGINAKTNITKIEWRPDGGSYYDLWNGDDDLQPTKRIYVVGLLLYNTCSPMEN